MIWIIGLGLPIATLIFLGGWLRGYMSADDSFNWGTGWDDGWDAGWKSHERVTAASIAKQHGAEEEEE